MSRILEYVISGPAYLRLGSEECADPDTLEMIKDLFTKVVHNQNSHEFSLLYNGMTEKLFGLRLQKYRPAIKHIHADSGGLQIITRGLKNSPEIREQVYENQGTYADVGMAFDEMPIKTTSSSGVSSKINMKTRYFDRENFEDYARRTGRNVKDQIEKFNSIGSSCKPFVILQGADHNTYYRWAELILEEVPKELHSNIGGVAMGSAALGMGSLEDAKRAFYVNLIPFEKPMHLHILGVGALKRMLPYLLFIQTGLYDNLSISYDSTTHSMSLDNGLFYFSQYKKYSTGYGGSSIKMGRQFSNIYRTVTDEINSVCGTDYSAKEFHEIMNIPIGKFISKGGKFIDIMRARLGFILTNVHNFTKDIEVLMSDKDAFLKFCRDKDCENEFAALFEVRTLDDLLYWEKHVGRYMDSDPVSQVPPASLESLFV